MNENQYKAGLDYLKRVDPDNGLLALAARGYNIVNCKYLEKALEQVEHVAEVAQETIVDDQTDSKIDPLDPSMLAMKVLISDLYKSRARLSNKFHDCATLEQRGKVSRAIGIVQKEIFNTMEKMEYFRKHGKPSIDLEVDDLPNDILELRKALLNNRSMLSRAMGRLKTLTSDITSPIRKVQRAQASVEKYKEKLQRIEQKIKIT